MKITELNKTNEKAYEDFVLSDKRNMLYSSVKYKNFLEDLLECESNYVVVEDDDNIVGAMPLFTKQGEFGKVVNSLPYYGSHGGIISTDEKAVSMLAEYYNNLIRQDDVAAANMVENPLYEVDYSNIVHNELQQRISQITSLDYDENIEDNIMEACHSKTRNMIRKSMKSGIDVTVDNDAMDFLEKTHNDNMAEIGGKAKLPRFFNLVMQYFTAGEDYKIYVAHKDGKPISAMLVFYYNLTIEYFTPVIVAEYRSYQPLSFLIYRGMIEGAEADYKYWNWGGTWETQEGVHRFKKRWNATDRIYKYYNQVNNKKLYDCSIAQLEENYDNFFVLPYGKLKSQ